MSKKSILNIVEIVMQITSIILLFVDGMFLVGKSQINLSYPYSFAGVCEDGKAFFLILILVMFVANIVICVASIFNKGTEMDSKLHTILPIINVVIMFSMGIIMHGVVLYNTRYFIGRVEVIVKQVGTLFYVAVFLLLAIVAVSIIKRSKMIVPKTNEEPVKVINNIQEAKSEADELKKYKDLLDSGVITQEEFNEKKKQLLGL